MNDAPITATATNGAMPSPKAGFDVARAAADTEARGNGVIRLLVFTSLYPNAMQPRHGIFVEERLRHLVGSGRIAATVVAPVPWFPFTHRIFGAYARYAAVPRREERHGIQIFHPRYPLIPKIGMVITPQCMYRALLPWVRRLLTTIGGCDVIDAHYLYPDGVAAVHIGRRLGKPVVVSARGSDVTLIPRFRLPRVQILQAAGAAAAIVSVSRALSERLERLGVLSAKLMVLRNGVDLTRFQPKDCSWLNARLNLKSPIWLAVGNLVPLKGLNLTITALADVPEVTLLVVGDGPEETNLRQLAQRLGVGARVHFLGAVPHAELPAYYNVADALILASSSEGMPNVVLEALACGTPAIVAPFDGAREVIGAPEAGQVAEFRTADAIGAAWAKLRKCPPGRVNTRRYAERFGWGPTVQAQLALYADILHTWGHGIGAEVMS